MSFVYHILCVLVVVWCTYTTGEAEQEHGTSRTLSNGAPAQRISSKDALSQLSDERVQELRNYYLSFDGLMKVRSLNFTYEHWMRDLMQSSFAERTLQQVVLPGTHDSGAYDLSSEVIPDHDDRLELIEEIANRLGLSIGSIVRSWGIAQFLTIHEQLSFGVRYFDLRPVFHPERKEWLVGHGTYGTTMNDLFVQIESFMHGHQEEIIIVELAHLMGHTQEDARNLALECEKVLGEFMLPRKNGLDLTLAEMVELNKRLIVSFFNEEVVDEFPLMHRQNLINNNYANTRLPNVLFDWAPERALEYTDNDFPDELYKISWTLTPDENSYLGMILPGNPRSLHDLSKKANPSLSVWAASLAQDNLTPGNLVNLDFCEDTELMRLVFEANERLSSP